MIESWKHSFIYRNYILHGRIGILYQNTMYGWMVSFETIASITTSWRKAPTAWKIERMLWLLCVEKHDQLIRSLRVATIRARIVEALLTLQHAPSTLDLCLPHKYLVGSQMQNKLTGKIFWGIQPGNDRRHLLTSPKVKPHWPLKRRSSLTSLPLQKHLLFFWQVAAKTSR